ncbi:MAG: cadmium-translocating P-type ATPase [Anaerolineales bacterium]|jgi:Cd2+/Zn2+-exporting ATPase|nr:cadmium-translocating P-type ATPase [Anaerolineales bacterium]MBX3037437.1 cadmium-translocating P-type ATPase [Anaerolineales bacterium]PWB78139.1 MAG: cadmium-translocating P-type ATPase [Anaerolineales bacterium]WKZ36324.1 MAG: cation-translocating P-type ATPase [Anaerolineales bacterium]GJQ36539.1 MAG: cadmium transporter ATPase [Anaerolineaceae bacterium]
MNTKQLELRVANLDCEHDAAAIERGLQGFPGIAELKIYPKSAKVAITYDPASTKPEAVKEKLESLGFPPQKGMEMAEQPKPWRNPKVLTSVASGVFLLIGWLLGLAGVPAIFSTVVYIAAILIGGYYFGREAIEELIFEREIGIELLMSTAAVVATIMGLAGEGAMLVFLYSISEAAEGYTEEKTRAAIKALMDLAPKVALVRRGGVEREIPVQELEVGDVFIVKPGEAMATDGEILVGASSVNQAPVTGESVPVEKQPGDPVFAGSINGEGALEVRATKTFADNTISRIIHMVEEAQEKKGKSQRFIERFGARYSPAVLAIGILIAIVPPLFFSADWVTWITRATVFIVAAAPCALVISIPITLVASLGTGARQGVLIKGGVYVEELAKVKVVAMDKTGTLTRGEPEVTDVLLLRQDPDRLAASQQQLLALAAGIERRSGHPLAQAIVRHAEAQGIQPSELAEFRSLTGAGASARLDGRTIYVGSPDMFHSKLGVSLDGVWGDINQLQGEGKTVVVLGDEEAPWGMIAIRDNIRLNAAKAIDAIHAAGVEKVVMLTGDNERTAQAIARELGIDEIYADLKPEDKVTKVRELAQRYGHVAMVGDGVNDAPALAEATVGVAMGAAGTDVALETADVALMADDLEKLAYALKLAKRNQSVVNQNLALSAIVIGALVIGAVAGAFSLPIAVLGHEISEFIVIGSGLRMLRA